MPTPRRITFVRHAMPAVDPASDPGEWQLSAAGRAAAMKLHLRADDSVVSSPERKALQTIALATGRPEESVPTDARFGEVGRTEPVHDDFRSTRQAWNALRFPDVLELSGR